MQTNCRSEKINIVVEYYNNKLIFDKVPQSEHKKIRELWEILREDYADWVADVRLKKISSDKTLAESFEWKGMSTWWLSPLVSKTVGVHHRWMNRLMVLYLCKNYLDVILIKTDDRLLIKSVKKNFINVNIVFLKSKQPSLKQYIKYRCRRLVIVLRYVYSFILHLERWLVLGGLAKKQKSSYPNLNESIWFHTLYPANWVKKESNIWQDRILDDSVIQDVQHKKQSCYLAYILRYGSDSSFGVFQLWKGIRSLKEKANRTVIFPQAHLKFFDILSVYINTFLEWRKFKKWHKNPLFINLFQLKGMDVSEILISEWGLGYWGNMQYCKLHGVATMRFLENLTYKPRIVNYGEFNIETRAAYHLKNLTDFGASYYALQHTQLSRNTGEAYNRLSEFSQDEYLDAMHYCPAPDYFLTHGEQYTRILSSFYPENRTHIMGSLKTKQYLNDIAFFDNQQNQEELLKELGVSKDKRTVLVALSSEDTEDICLMLRKWIPKEDINVIFTPHPSSNISEVKKIIDEHLGHLIIRLESKISTLKILKCVDLVICGFSNIAYESLIYGVPSVVLTPLGSFFPREIDPRINEFYDGKSFNSWFNNYSWIRKENHHNIELREMASKYYGPIDGLASERMWNYIIKPNLILDH